MRLLALEHRGGRLHGVDDLLGDELAGPAQSRRGGDVCVDPLLGGFEVEHVLQVLCFGRFSDPGIGAGTGPSFAACEVQAHVRLERFDQARVVRLERAQDPSDRPVTLGAFLECRGNVGTGIDDDGDDDVTQTLARGPAHDAPDCLHDVDLAVARVHEGDRVERRDVDAFGEQTHVRDDVALAPVAGCGQGAQCPGPGVGVVPRVQVPRDDFGGAFATADPACGRALDLAVAQCFDVPLRTLDAVGEHQGSVQLARTLVGGAFGRAVDGERDAEHARHRTRVDASRAFDPLQALAQPLGQALAVRTEHDDPVVAEHALGDRRRERQVVQRRAVDRRIAHVDDFEPALAQAPLGALGVHPRGRRHVQALVRVQEHCVVEGPEVGLSIRTNGTRRAVRLVGDREVEVRRPHLLGFDHPAKTVVGAEHDVRAIRVCPKASCDFGRVGADRTLELVRADVFALASPASRSVRAHDGARECAGRVAQPLASGLRDQRDGRGGEQDPPVVGDEPLGDPQRGERLARPAGHDEASPVVDLESFDDVLDGFALEPPRLLDGTRGVFGLDPGVEVSGEVDPAYRRVRGVERSPGVRSDRAGDDQPAQREDRALRGGEELVDLPLGQGVSLVVTLALDGDVLAGRSAGDQVHADVRAVEAVGLAIGPVDPAPDLVDLEGRVLAHDPHEELFEPAALLRSVAAFGADPCEHLLGTRVVLQVEGRCGGVVGRCVQIHLHSEGLRRCCPVVRCMICGASNRSHGRDWVTGLLPCEREHCTWPAVAGRRCVVRRGRGALPIPGHGPLASGVRSTRRRGSGRPAPGGASVRAPITRLVDPRRCSGPGSGLRPPSLSRSVRATRQ